MDKMEKTIRNNLCIEGQAEVFLGEPIRITFPFDLNHFERFCPLANNGTCQRKPNFLSEEQFNKVCSKEYQTCSREYLMIKEIIAFTKKSPSTLYDEVRI